MKNILKSTMLLAAAAAAFASCEKAEISAPVNGETVTFSATASLPGSTKTTIGSDNKVLWSAQGEKAELVEIYTPASGTASLAAVASKSCAVSEDLATATFQFDLTAKTAEGTYDYYAVYPSTAYSNGSASYKDLTIKVPGAQTPTATSADPAASVIVAIAGGKTAQPTSVELQFGHIVAYGRMTLTGLKLAEGETLSSITIKATDKKISGNCYWYWETGKVTSSNGSDEITIDAKNLTVADGKVTAMFAAIPFSLAADDVFNVSYTTSADTYSYEVTMEKGVEFTAGKIGKFTVDMSYATKSADYSGTYVAVIKNGTSFLALSSKPNGDRLNGVTLTDMTAIPTKYETFDPSIVWVVEKSGGNYSFKNAEKYLAYHKTDGNYAGMVAEAAGMTIKPGENGVYQIAPVADASRALKYNTSSKYFAFYALTSTTNMVADFYLVPVDYDDTPSIKSVTTKPVDTITATGATIKGSYEGLNILSTTTITAGFTIGSTDYTATVDKATSSFQATVTGLTTNQEYTVKAWASVDGGTTKVYGAEEKFTPANVVTRTYTMTITPSDFNTTSYSANNKEKKTVATATDDSGETVEVSWTSNQVMKNTSGNIQFQKTNGYIYNTTSLGAVQSVTISTTSTSLTTYYGSSENPTTDTAVSGGYFTIKNGNATATATAITVTFIK